MEIIKSKSNPIIKKAFGLKIKKIRQAEMLALIEGIKVIQEAQKQGVEIKFILTCGSDELKDFNCEKYFVSEDIIKHLSSQVTPQKEIAVIKTSKTQLKLPENDFLILDNLQDPSNMGAIIRSAVATGFKDIYLINCCDIYNEKVIRASMGNMFKCNFYDIDYEFCKKIDKPMYIADMNGENVFNLDKIESSLGFIIGNEGHGVSEELRKFVKNKISIPMQNGVESLNAAVSASIIMYTLINKRSEL